MHHQPYLSNRMQTSSHAASVQTVNTLSQLLPRAWHAVPGSTTLFVSCRKAWLAFDDHLSFHPPELSQVEQHEGADGAKLFSKALAVTVELQVQPHAGAVALKLLQHSTSINSINLCAQGKVMFKLWHSSDT